MTPVLLFDGDCGFCNRWVSFVLRHEVSEVLQFVPLQSDLAIALLTPHCVDGSDLSTIYLLDHQGVHQRSDAALRIASLLRRPWRWARGLQVIPRTWRDAAYDFIGRHRYRLQGTTGYCVVANQAPHRFPDLGRTSGHTPTA